MSQDNTSLSIEQVGKRLYVAGNSYAVKDRLKSIGCKWDGDRKQWWIGTAKRAELEQIVNATASSEQPAEDADSIRLVGKGKYKGKTWYIRWMGTTKSGKSQARLVNLDASVDFWADLDQVEIVKRYESRERTYRGRTTTQYTTLGSIRRFIEQAKADEAAKQAGTAETQTCWECGREFTGHDARCNGGNWSESYCGC